MNTTLPQAINTVGAGVADTVRQFKLWWAVAQQVGAAIQTSFYLVAHAVLEVAEGVLNAQSAMTFGLSDLTDSAIFGIRDKLNAAQVSIDTAGAAALDRMVKLNDEVNSLWNQPAYKPLYLAQVPIGPVMDGWAAKYQKPAATPTVPHIATPLPSGGGKGGGTKTDPELERLKKWLEQVKDLVSTAKDASKTLYDDLRRPFAKLRPTVQSELQQAFTSGDAETVITQFEKTRDAIREMFAPLESKELNKSASSRKAAVRLRKQYIAELQKSTGELVKLAEADRVAQATFDEIEKQVTAAQADIEKRRTALAAQYAAQQKVITRQFDSYYEATSATQGRFVKGAIDTAQAALDAATTAYEAARDKLDELKAARDDYLSSLADTVRSYVNDLSNVTKEIERYTRLDNVGSFSMVTESQASVASFKASLTERLEALKKWRTDVATLLAGGLDSTLLKDLVAQGPEATKDLVGSLAGASSDEIAQINALQSQLSEQITGMQKEASAKWFDAGIAAQEAFTAPLKAAMDAAQAQVDALNQQKDLALGVLEAWNAEQTELLDAQQAEQDARLATAQATLNATLEANKAKATTIANAIQKTLGTLPGHAVAMGIDTIQGLIDGLESKKSELLAAARKIAEEVRSTIASALDIHSPPPWAIEMGGDISTGLAMGMEGSLDRIAVASDAMAAAAVPSVNAASPSALTFAPGITVKIGDRELIDIVDVQIEQRDAESLSYVLAGRRR
jgi:hypothetical protein